MNKKRYTKALKKAEKIAVENRDAELLVAISDRWYAFSHSDEDDAQSNFALGFINQENGDDSRKTADKRKG